MHLSVEICLISLVVDNSRADLGLTIRVGVVWFSQLRCRLAPSTRTSPRTRARLFLCKQFFTQQYWHTRTPRGIAGSDTRIQSKSLLRPMSRLQSPQPLIEKPSSAESAFTSPRFRKTTYKITNRQTNKQTFYGGGSGSMSGVVCAFDCCGCLGSLHISQCVIMLSK